MRSFYVPPRHRGLTSLSNTWYTSLQPYSHYRAPSQERSKTIIIGTCRCQLSVTTSLIWLQNIFHKVPLLLIYTFWKLRSPYASVLHVQHLLSEQMQNIKLFHICLYSELSIFRCAELNVPCTLTIPICPLNTGSLDVLVISTALFTANCVSCKHWSKQKT